MTTESVAIFADTNLFLHYRSIDEIDWCALVKARAVVLAIAAVVTRELEEQRVVHQSRRIRNRATSSIKLLQKYIRDSHVRDGVALQFLTDEPTADYAAANNLNLLLADDRLIGTYLLFRDANPSVRCVMVTNDLPLTVKFTHRQIEFISLDESSLLPSEPDPIEKKYKQLEAELQRYKSRQPDLSVKFSDGENHARFRLIPPTNMPDPEPEIRTKVEAAKEKCKPVDLAPPPEPVDSNHPFAGIAQQLLQVTEGFQLLGRQFYEDYNRRVERYYREYEKYLRETVEFKARDTRTIELELVLHNSGTCPAEDIDVYLHFPDGFLLYDERSTPEPPEEPAIPSKEPNLTAGLLMPDSLYLGRTPTLPDRTLPRIRKTNSYDVTFKVPKLKHDFIHKIEAFYVAFDSWASVASFAIDYSVHAGNMMDKQTGQLGLIVDRS